MIKIESDKLVLNKKVTLGKGKRDADGNIVLTIDGDFTKCGTRVEAIMETFTEADGTESQRVKEYAVSCSFH